MSEKTKSKLQKSLKDFLSMRWIDIVMILIFLVILFLDIFVFKKTISEETEVANESYIATGIPEILEEGNSFLEKIADAVKDNFYINAIISVLCPVISTVLSVSISVYSDNIYGLKIIDFRKLRKKDNYSLATMIIIPIIILVLCIALYYFNLWITVIVLNAIAVFYVIFFIIREIPLLTKNRKRIDSIIRNRTIRSIDNEDSNKSNLLSDNNDIVNLNTAITNYIYSDGIEAAVKMMGEGRYNIETFSLMLEKSNKKIVDERFEVTNENVQLYKNHLKNTIQYLKLIGNSFEVDESASTNMYYENTITDAIYYIGLVFGNAGMNNQHSDDLMDIVSYLIPSETTPESAISYKDSFLTRVSNNLVIVTAKHSTLWYYNAILTFFNKNPQRIAHESKKDIVYAIFLSIYLFYVSQRKKVDDEFKNEIKKLENDALSNIIQEEILIEHIFDVDLYIALLVGLLNYYKEINDISFWVSDYDCDDDHILFNQYYIFVWWLYLFAPRYPSIINAVIKDALKELTDEQKKDLEEINKYYGDDINDDDKKLINELKNYYKEYKIEPHTPEDVKQSNSEIQDSISKLHESTKNLQKSLTNLQNLSKMFNFGREIKTKIDNAPFHSNDLTVNILDHDTKQYNRDFICTQKQVEEFVMSFGHDINNWIATKFSDDIKNSEKQLIAAEDYRKLVDFFNSQKSGEANASNIPPFNEKAIQFNALIMPNTFCSKLNNTEIDNIINRQFEMVNGLYKVNTQNSSDSGIFLTKKALVEEISNTYRHVVINIFYIVKIDYDNMFFHSDSTGEEKNNK